MCTDCGTQRIGDKSIMEDNLSLNDTSKLKVINHEVQSLQEQQRLTSLLPENNKVQYLLLSDTTANCAPLHLRNILNHFNDSQLNQLDLLFILIYTVALESGYMCESDYIQTMVSPLPSISSFHSKNVERLSKLKPIFIVTPDKKKFIMKLSSVVDDKQVNAEQIYALLTATVCDELMIVTLSPANCLNSAGFSTVLPISRYVLDEENNVKLPFHRFCKMPELTTILRDKLFVPMRNKHLSWMQANIYPSLDAMPVELYENLLQYLNKYELNSLAKVNWNLFNVTVRSKHYENLRKSHTHVRSVHRYSVFPIAYF
uniref:F-box domain-containing protein n=1 Tax=Glossina morsitans morsitans TaxID=37546 RepID=A0A1B0FM52_GLOMM